MMCEHMHWTYDDYIAQPQWLIETLRIKLSEDGIYQTSQQKNR